MLIVREILKNRQIAKYKFLSFNIKVVKENIRLRKIVYNQTINFVHLFHIFLIAFMQNTKRNGLMFCMSDTCFEGRQPISISKVNLRTKNNSIGYRYSAVIN